MTTAQYAAHRQVSDSYVRRLRREARLVQKPGSKLIDVTATDALLEATNDPLRGGSRLPAAGGDTGSPLATGPLFGGQPSVKEAVRQRVQEQVRKLRMDNGEAARLLTRRKDVDRAVFTLARQALERLRRIPSRLRAQLAAETGVHECELLLQGEVDLICQELQKAAVKLRAQMAHEAGRGSPDSADDPSDDAMVDAEES